MTDLFLAHGRAPWGAFLAFCFLATAAHAQPQTPPPPESREKVPASLRGWILRGKDDSVLVLRLKAESPDAAPLSLASSPAGGDGAMAEAYSPLLPGSYVAETLAGDQIQATEKIAVVSGKSYTLVSIPDAGGKRQLKLFDDGPQIASAAPRSLRVLNFADSRQTRLNVGKSPEVLVAADSVQELKLPPAQTSVATSVLAKDGGAPAQSFAVVDLSLAAAAYLAVMPDAKGRFRPRPILGALPAPKTVPTPPAKIVEPSAEQIRTQKLAGLQLELDAYSARLALMGPEKAGGNDAQVRKELQQKISEVRAQVQSSKAAPKATPGAPPQGANPAGSSAGN